MRAPRMKKEKKNWLFHQFFYIFAYVQAVILLISLSTELLLVTQYDLYMTRRNKNRYTHEERRKQSDDRNEIVLFFSAAILGMPGAQSFSLLEDENYPTQ
ncbi:hypothetical protein OUZ56_015909 [Daphnia magna]|uniref:Uncharacterized protein n=1 Tax=Daphnia magna TaxID=35525 RepID=A0ABR0AP50_9CRUS|nr:hypothetical protein OUZ56_015909 [Daphnia magna]